MRIVAAFAVVCSLAGGIWLELTRERRNTPPIAARRTGAAEGGEAAIALECGGPANAPRSRIHDLPSLGNAALLTIERVPVRRPGSTSTLAAWRMDVSSDQGAGTITSLELPDGACYAGDGVLAGWAAEDLARAFRELTPEPPAFELDLAPRD